MISLPIPVKNFIDKFHTHKYQIFLVGGAVRNLILGRETTNWDFTTDANPEEIIKMFPDAFYNNIYGTVSVPVKITVSGQTLTTIFEITPFRKESGYSDSRHPDKIVWAKTIEEDLARRDFTINAIAFDGKEIVDPYGGRKHLDDKVISAVGDPDNRFTEDGLRLIRAVRFASQLGFVIDEKTRRSMSKNSSLIAKISWERIRDEFIKIMASGFPSEGILFMKNTGLLIYVLPEVDACFKVPQKSPKRHHIYDVGTHLVMSLKFCPSSDPITRFATLIHDTGKAETFHRDNKTGLITFYNHEVAGKKIAGRIADRFKLSNKEKDKLVKLVQFHQFTVSEIQTDKAVRRFIKNVGKEYLDDIIDLRYGDRIGSGATPTSWRFDLFRDRIKQVQKQPFLIKDLKVNGHDVMEILKIKPGKKVGEVLKKLFDIVVDKKIANKRQELLREIRRFRD